MRSFREKRADGRTNGQTNGRTNGGEIIGPKSASGGGPKSFKMKSKQKLLFDHNPHTKTSKSDCI